MKIKRYVVTAVDYASKTPEVRAVCKTNDEAKNFTLEDMREYAYEHAREYAYEHAREYAYEHANEGIVFDDKRLRVAEDDRKAGCEWNIEDVEIDIDETDVTEFCNAAYNEGYRDGVAETEAGEDI